MSGLEIIKAPSSTAGEIADIISKPCPPITPAECDRVSCRECWLAWLTTGGPPKRKGPSSEQTAPSEESAPYRPPTEAIRRAAERVREGNMEYTASELIRTHDDEEPPQF